MESVSRWRLELPLALNETAIDIAACRTCGFGSARNASTSRLAGTDMTVERRIIELPRGDVYGSKGMKRCASRPRRWAASP